MLALALPMQSDLSATWTDFWGRVSGELGGVTQLLAFVGLVLIVGSIIKYFWDRRRGGANAGQLLWAFGAGAILAAPDFLIPLFLNVVDLLINAFGSAGAV